MLGDCESTGNVLYGDRGRFCLGVFQLKNATKWTMLDDYVEQVETIMYCLNCKLIHFYIYAKIDNLGNVLHQLNIILHSQIPKENSANQFQQILQRFLPKNENAVPSFGNCCSVTKSFLTLWPHELKHARLPCLSLCPRICSNSCPVS